MYLSLPIVFCICICTVVIDIIMYVLYTTYYDLVLKASSCPHGMISNLSLNLDSQGSSL